MVISKITVSASRKIPHPAAEFASLSALVSLDADLEREDDPARCIEVLQERAEESVDRHLRKLSANIQARERIERGAARAKAGTESKIESLISKHGGGK